MNDETLYTVVEVGLDPMGRLEVVRPGGDAWWFATVDEFIDAFAEGAP